MRILVDTRPDGLSLVVGESLHEVNETRGRLVVALLVASAGAVAAVLTLAWWPIRLGLRPLHQVEASASAISDSGLGDQRVQPV